MTTVEVKEEEKGGRTRREGRGDDKHNEGEKEDKEEKYWEKKRR